MPLIVENIVIMSQRVEVSPGDIRDRIQEIGTFTGPASYSLGGFVIDRSDFYSKLENVSITIQTGTFLGRFAVESDWSASPPGPGKFRIKALGWSVSLVKMSLLQEAEVILGTDLSNIKFRYSAMGLTLPTLA